MTDGSGEQITLDTTEAIEAATLVQDLFECCDQPGAIEAENIGLGQGAVAMVLANHGVHAWVDEFPDLVEQDAAGFIVFPRGPSATEDVGVTTLEADIISVTANSEHPEEAADFLAWLTAEPEQATAFAGLGQDIPGSAAAQGSGYFDESPYVGVSRDLLSEVGGGHAGSGGGGSIVAWRWLPGTRPWRDAARRPGRRDPRPERPGSWCDAAGEPDQQGAQSCSSIHRPSSARSSSVISVMLPGGMTSERTATASIRSIHP